MLLVHFVTAALISFQQQHLNTRLSQRCWRAVRGRWSRAQNNASAHTRHVFSLNGHEITVVQYFLFCVYQDDCHFHIQSLSCVGCLFLWVLPDLVLEILHMKTSIQCRIVVRSTFEPTAHTSNIQATQSFEVFFSRWIERSDVPCE